MENKEKKCIGVSNLANESIITNSNEWNKNKPIIVEEIINLFTDNFKDLSKAFITNLVITKLAQMITSKRVTLVEVGKIVIPNWYSILFAASGYGKDQLNKELDETVFLNFRLFMKDKFKDKYKEELSQIEEKAIELYNDERQKKAYIETEKKNIRPLVLEMQDGTQEGFFCEAKAFEKAQFGSLFLKMSEFGLKLNNASNESMQFINCMYTAYDGKVESKSIKSGIREEEVNNIPVNMSLFSDYTLFKGDLRSTFDLLMQTGLGRRAMISFIPIAKLTSEIRTYEEEEEYRQSAKELGEKLIKLFFRIENNSCYKLTADAKNSHLNTYKAYLTNLFNNTEDELLKKEIKSRELKALKLSCLYAALNHPSELLIKTVDIQQAITTIEELSNDIKKFLSYIPHQNDVCDNVFNFFMDNLNKAFTKTDLKVKHFKLFKISRSKFSKEFDEIIKTVADIAETKGYKLEEYLINNNVGKSYTLLKNNS